MFVAAGSGITQEGSKRWIVFKLGTTDAFNPEGANIIKLCANTGLNGSFVAKYRSKYIKAAIKYVFPAPIGKLNK